MKALTLQPLRSGPVPRSSGWRTHITALRARDMNTPINPSSGARLGPPNYGDAFTYACFSVVPSLPHDVTAEDPHRAGNLSEKQCSGSRTSTLPRTKSVQRTTAVVPLNSDERIERHAWPRHFSERRPHSPPARSAGRPGVAARRASVPCPRGFCRPAQNGPKWRRK
jgi:hypothetical protein